MNGEEIFLQRERSPETYEQRKQTITESLRERARNIAEAGKSILTSARSENGPLVWPSSLGSAAGQSEILASTSAVAVGRKLLYHEEWAGYAENDVLLGYGQKLYDVPAVPVNLLDADGNIIGGIFANPATAATIRAKGLRNTSALLPPLAAEAVLLWNRLDGGAELVGQISI